MSDRIKVVELRQTCGACPSQWKGRTDDDRAVYVRFRWGHGYVSIGARGDHSEFAAVGEVGLVAEWFDDDPGLGCISEADMMRLTSHAVDWSAAAPTRGTPEGGTE